MRSDSIDIGADTIIFACKNTQMVRQSNSICAVSAYSILEWRNHASAACAFTELLYTNIDMNCSAKLPYQLNAQANRCGCAIWAIGHEHSLTTLCRDA